MQLKRVLGVKKMDRMTYHQIQETAHGHEDYAAFGMQRILRGVGLTISFMK